MLSVGRMMLYTFILCLNLIQLMINMLLLQYITEDISETIDIGIGFTMKLLDAIFVRPQL